MNWSPEFEAKFNALQAELRSSAEEYAALLLATPSPSPLPNPPDTDSQTIKGGGDSIYVNSITGDGS